MLYQHARKKYLWFFLVTFVVTGGRSWSFKNLNFEVFKTKLENLFVYNFVC